MKRVLFISSLYCPHVGGIETMIAELSSVYNSQGIETIILTKKWPSSLSSFEEYRGIEIYRVPSARTKEEFDSIIEWAFNNTSKIKSDIIHVVGIRRPLPLIALLLARAWGVPIICTIAGGDIPDEQDSWPTKVWEDGKDIIPHVLRQSNRVTCVSASLTCRLWEVMPDLEGVDTLYAGIDFKIIRQSEPVKDYGQYIFALRRLDPSKGIDILIRGFNLIKNRFPELRLIIAGEGTEETKLRRLVGRLKLDDRVEFIGTLSLSRGIGLLKGALLTVVPSLSEGGGLVNIEAQAAGCPVIASRVGGIPEYVKDGASGLLFKSGDYYELAQKITLLLTDEDLRKLLIRGGYRHAKQFDWKKLSVKYLDLYREAKHKQRKDKIFMPWSNLTRDLWFKINFMKKMEDILKEYSLEEAAPIKLVRESGDNTVYCIGKMTKKILRVSKRLPVGDILFEHAAMQHLRLNGVPVPNWETTRAGKVYSLIDGHVAVVSGFVDGWHLNIKEHLPTLIQAYNAGMGLGQIGNAAKSFKGEFLRARTIYSELERVMFMSDMFRKSFINGTKFVDRVEDALKFGKRQDELMGLIHNDYRPSNVFFDNLGGLTGVIDFDWSCVGPIIKDLALALVEWSFPDGATGTDFEIFDAFLAGYNTVSKHKFKKDQRMYSWIKFAALSDASTYFCDKVIDSDRPNKTLNSYMYQKYLFFSKL